MKHAGSLRRCWDLNSFCLRLHHITSCISVHSQTHTLTHSDAQNQHLKSAVKQQPLYWVFNRLCFFHSLASLQQTKVTNFLPQEVLSTCFSFKPIRKFEECHLLHSSQVPKHLTSPKNTLLDKNNSHVLSNYRQSYTFSHIYLLSSICFVNFFKAGLDILIF